MTERRTLMDGLKTAVALADPKKEAEFVLAVSSPSSPDVTSSDRRSSSSTPRCRRIQPASSAAVPR